MSKTCRLIIRGRVQGVGYRAFLRHEAQRHGVAGWVRNRRDGSVEAVLQGSAEAVQSVIEHARRGPHGARVTDVEVSEDAGVFTGFEQRPTE